MTAENISWSISAKECCRIQWGSTCNLQITSRSAYNWATEARPWTSRSVTTSANWDRQAWANSIDTDQTPQNTVSDQWTGSTLFATHPVVFRHIRRLSKRLLSNYSITYVKELRCPNINDKCPEMNKMSDRSVYIFVSFTSPAGQAVITLTFV